MDLVCRLALRIRTCIEGRLQRRDGQGLVEYALLLGLIAVIVMVALKFISSDVSTVLNSMANSL